MKWHTQPEIQQMTDQQLQQLQRAIAEAARLWDNCLQPGVALETERMLLAKESRKRMRGQSRGRGPSLSMRLG